MYELKKDKYSEARGNGSRILAITCSHCNSLVAYYQKDGPGILKRLYFDRIIDRKFNKNDLKCSKCSRVLGAFNIYEKENRKAIRLFVGAVNKKIISRSKVALHSQ